MHMDMCYLEGLGLERKMNHFTSLVRVDLLEKLVKFWLSSKLSRIFVVFSVLFALLRA